MVDEITALGMAFERECGIKVFLFFESFDFSNGSEARKWYLVECVSSFFPTSRCPSYLQHHQHVPIFSFCHHLVIRW